MKNVRAATKLYLNLDLLNFSIIVFLPVHYVKSSSIHIKFGIRITRPVKKNCDEFFAPLKKTATDVKKNCDLTVLNVAVFFNARVGLSSGAG